MRQRGGECTEWSQPARVNEAGVLWFVDGIPTRTDKRNEEMASGSWSANMSRSRDFETCQAQLGNGN